MERNARGLMTQGSAPGNLIQAQLPAGASFHDLRTRKAGARRFIEFHLLVPGETSVNQSHALCDGIEYSIKSHLSNASVTIHVEPVETETPVPE